MVKSAFLRLSQNRQLRRFMETSPFARKLTRRFIAGNTLEDGLRVAAELSRMKMTTALDHLGENVTSEEEASHSSREILNALEEIAARRLEATVSIKLTQFGLDLGREICRAKLEPVMRRACEIGTRVEIDMESSVYTQQTVDLVKEMHVRFGCVRAVLQAYLHRTAEDVQAMNTMGIPVRLCKGAYKEPDAVALQSKAEVDTNFIRLMERLLVEGTMPAIATHDGRILEHAVRFLNELHVPRDRYEFQMLYGVRREWQRRLVDDGHAMRLYVPYGDAWYPYFMRRLGERPANMIFLLGTLWKD